jgi:hypothetical protein
MRETNEVVRTAASVTDRIKSISRAGGLETRYLQQRFALERFLQRVAKTEWADKFVLKGGMVMLLLGADNRPTEDIDAHCGFAMDANEAKRFVEAVCGVEPDEEDGLIFSSDPMKAEPIMESSVPGMRIRFSASYAAANGRGSPMVIKLDLAWNDSILEPVKAAIPSIIRDYPALCIPTYCWEQIVAEKLHAICRHGMANTRMKDYFDLAVIGRKTALDAGMCCSAITETFRAWGYAVEPEMDGLTAAFGKMAQPLWRSFIASKNNIRGAPDTLTETIAEIRPLALPLLVASAAGEILNGTWETTGGWTLAPRLTI